VVRQAAEAGVRPDSGRESVRRWVRDTRCGHGGNGSDTGYGIAVDSAGNAYVAGTTDSSQATFPVTVGPDLTSNGGFDAFVAKVFYTDFKLYLPLILR
jgi:hypothetical protein